jgi:hypothetical protein
MTIPKTVKNQNPFPDCRVENLSIRVRQGIQYDLKEKEPFFIVVGISDRNHSKYRHGLIKKIGKKYEMTLSSIKLAHTSPQAIPEC